MANIINETEINAVIAKNIQSCMNERGLSQKELASALGVSQASISNWCQGIKMPRMDKIDRICDFFGIKRSYLLCDHRPHGESAPFHDAINTLIEERPEFEELFEALENATPEAVSQAVKILKALQE